MHLIDLIVSDSSIYVTLDDKTSLKVEVKQSVKFTLFSKLTSTLIKKIYNKHD